MTIYVKIYIFQQFPSMVLQYQGDSSVSKCRSIENCPRLSLGHYLFVVVHICLRQSVAFINRSDVDVSVFHASWSFKRSYDYAHSQQRDRGMYACIVCGRSYKVRRSLWRHRKYECVNAKPAYTCEMCPYTSPHKWCIDKHRNRWHRVTYQHRG